MSERGTILFITLRLETVARDSPPAELESEQKGQQKAHHQLSIHILNSTALVSSQVLLIPRQADLLTFTSLQRMLCVEESLTDTGFWGQILILGSTKIL